MRGDNCGAFGARKMYVLLNRGEIAECRGAGHVARCTVGCIMGEMGVSGIRKGEVTYDEQVCPQGSMSDGSGEVAFWCARVHQLVGGIHYLCDNIFGRGVRRVRHRPLLGSDPRVVHFDQPVHRPRLGCVDNGDLAA